jgi:exopolysaccharide biosynthesis polyprenyl glycosylphosphotransferase
MPSQEAREATLRRRNSGASRRLAPIYLSPLPAYDIRVTRELAHRRLVVSMLRHALRLLTLHVLDGAAVAGALAITAWLVDAPSVLHATPALIAFMLVGLNVRGSYGAGPARRDSQRIVTAVFIALLLVVIPSTLPADAQISMTALAVFGLASCAVLIVERQLVDAVVHQAYTRGIGLRRALVISRTQDAADVVAGLQASPSDHDKDRPVDQLVVGYVTPEDTRDPEALGSVGRLKELLDRHDVSELVIATSLRESMLGQVTTECFGRGIRVFVIPPVAHRVNLWSELTHVGRWPAYHLHPTRLELPALVLKRAFDLVLASIGLVLLSPVMLLLAAFIKLETHGPVFFRQRRVGLGGREFMMWKFRSMLNEAEARRSEIAHLNHYADGRLFKLADDPRVTRVGAFLRRFSLDELPQLFNVLSGEMSLVGPRPPLPAEVASYEERHFVRLSVVPGMTGPWQVNGRNLITDFEQVVGLERDYIENWSLRSDVEITLRTLRVVLSGKGAY